MKLRGKPASLGASMVILVYSEKIPGGESMFKKTLLTAVVGIIVPTMTYPMFELGKTAPDEKNLVQYPGGTLYKFTTPKKIIVRRSDGTLKYGIAKNLTARGGTPLFLTLVDVDKTIQKNFYKGVSYSDIYLAPEWLSKDGDTFVWSPEAEAGTILNEVEQH